MANDRIVINTGPLILLGKIDALEVVGKLPFQFVCPPAVRAELDDGVSDGKDAVAPVWLKVVELSAPLSPMVEMSLDRGEAEVIQLAMENGIATVCIDDLRGRKIAEMCGLTVTGVLGLLGRAKHLGLIHRLRPLTDVLLQKGGRYSPKLLHEFLTDFGE